MSSGELDAFLELYGDGVTLSDDDSGSQNVDARITAELPARGLPAGGAYLQPQWCRGLHPDGDPPVINHSVRSS